MYSLENPRLRFAPSPTGHLHIGGARTALFNWLLARRHGGRFVLRLEDTDRERSTRAFEEEILQDLAWLGLQWDEGPHTGGPHAPYRQSERSALYEDAVERLLNSGKAYRCTCDVERLERVRKEALEAGRNPAYDGHCRDRDLGPDCGPHVVRFAMPRKGITVIEDLVKGRVEIRNQELDDFVIRRTDGAPTYNFVVVVDDADMEITHVLRGDDHLVNTAKQVGLYRALDCPPPAFGHMPLILGPDGQRLSKRHGATSLGAYREMGYLPEAMLNYLARLGWAHGDLELFSVAELVRLFSIEGVGRSAGRWDREKLDWVNQQWMQRLSPARIAEHLRPLLERSDLDVDPERLEPAIRSVQKRSTTLVEMVEQMAFYFVADDALEMDEKAVHKFLRPVAGPRLRKLVERLRPLETWTADALEEAIRPWLEQEGLKLRHVAQPVRVSVSGRRSGPGLWETLEALGREISIRRLEKGAQRAEKRAEADS